ncbi:MAG: hypothetical protein D9V44_09940 [Actinobacteria bacterium]|nr:MAG: hypothetical protein D9V44_09940 [Actinomycetota bacterium]
MPKNVLDVWGELMAISIGTVVLVLAALAFSFKHHARTQPGSSGHRPPEQQEDAERISPDGYIDSFSGLIEEAGGSLPPIGWVIVGLILVSYVAYLILFWTPA